MVGMWIYHMAKFTYSFGIILLGLALGYGIQVLYRRRIISLPIAIDDLRKLLQKTALLFVNPVAIMGAIWVVNIQDIKIATLPFIGLFALLLGGVLALGFARVIKLPPYQTGAMYGCGSFTNIGSIGALICFVYLGETGFALVPIYKIFEELSYYAIGFPIARYYSDTEQEETPLSRIKNMGRDPFIIVALSSIIMGGFFNAANIDRPLILGTIVSLFVPLGTILLLTSIGLAMRFRRVRDYLKVCISISVIKFLLVPLLTFSLAYLIGLGEMDNGLPLKVVLILSSMPVAFNALIPPSIYDLDLDLANSCWFFTTALLAIVLPVLLYIINLF